MLKLLGIACIVLGAGAVGFGCARRLRRQAQQLADLQTALCLMKSELLCRMTPLPELLENAGKSVGSVVGRLFRRMAEQMRQDLYASPQALFTQTLRELSSLNLPPQAEQALLGLFLALGQFDAEGQCRSIDLASARLREQTEILEKSRIAQSRSYRTIGICAGFAIAVILL